MSDDGVTSYVDLMQGIFIAMEEVRPELRGTRGDLESTLAYALHSILGNAHNIAAAAAEAHRQATP